MEDMHQHQLNIQYQLIMIMRCIVTFKTFVR